jgi:hypothetical protein
LILKSFLGRAWLAFNNASLARPSRESDDFSQMGLDDLQARHKKVDADSSVDADAAFAF